MGRGWLWDVSSGVQLQSVQERSVGLPSPCAWGTGLLVERGLVPGLTATSTEQTSEVTWGWWTSMAAVVTTQVAGSGALGPATQEGRRLGRGLRWK